jgi:hypothetical protein
MNHSSSPEITERELVQIALDNWNANRGADPRVLEDIGYDTPDTLPGTIDRVTQVTRKVGEEVIGQEARLTLVVEESPDASLTAPAVPPLRKPPKPRNWRERHAADQGRRMELKPPPEWTPLLLDVSKRSA